MKKEENDNISRMDNILPCDTAHKIEKWLKKFTKSSASNKKMSQRNWRFEVNKEQTIENDSAKNEEKVKIRNVR